MAKYLFVSGSAAVFVVVVTHDDDLEVVGIDEDGRSDSGGFGGTYMFCISLSDKYSTIENVSR